jgi:uncharacterized RmlC-like cupin family protein
MTEDPSSAPATVVPAAALQPADPTPGMTRRLAFETARTWTGTVDTDPGAISGWHHHGDHDTTLYVVRGRMRLQSGPAGSVVVDAGPGDFLHVPPYAVHRESNPGEQVATAVIVRSGEGPPTTNVEGPAAD